MIFTKLVGTELPAECSQAEAAAIAATCEACDSMLRWVRKQNYRQVAPLLEDIGGQVLLEGDDITVHLPGKSDPAKFSLKEAEDFASFRRLAEAYHSAILKMALEA